MNKKGIIDCGTNFSLWLIIIVFMIALIIGVFIGFKVDEHRSLERSEIEYECPILFEQGNYLFIDGTLISPSLERLKCIEVEKKEHNECIKTEKGYCAIECYENDRLIPCENFTYDEHFCNEGICEASGGCPDYFEILEGKTIGDCIREVEEGWNLTEYFANRFPPPIFINTTGKENG